MKRDLKCLVIVFIFFLCIAGCESRQFKAEREMWRAHKAAQAIYKNPKGTPQFQLEKAQDAYRAIIKKYPNSLFAAQCQFSIGHLYLVTGQFDKARAEYKKLTVDCAKKGNLCAESYFAIGNSYELEGRWDDALANYRLILEQYPFSAKSLDLPIYIIRHYKKAGDDIAVKRSVDEAISYYYGLKSKTKGGKGGYILEGLVARSYLEAGFWQDALEALEKINRDYPKENGGQALLMKAVIYISSLNDKVKAKQELQRIITEHPGSKFVNSAKNLLNRLK